MIKTDLNKDRAILTDFLKTWPLERVEKMSLDEYVNVKDPETFCQYVETKTRPLGSIKGLNSIKFGIYKRGDKKKRPKNAVSDDSHSWLSYFGEKKNVAFVSVKSDLMKIIESAQRLDLEKIDDIHLHSIFKWKVAFLYSNEGFIPIFKKDALHLIAENLGLAISKNTKYSEIHRFIAKTKPIGISVYDYMRKLYSEYRIEQESDKKDKQGNSTKRKARKATGQRNTSSQNRKGTREYVAEQFHNELQEKLEKFLSDKYGVDKVVLEENYIDVKLTLKNEIHYYEVKTAGFAEDCIRQGLGQLLSYVHYENDKRKKKLIIFGKNKPNDQEVDFIDFVKSQFNKVDFEYLSLTEIENE
jgi:hypothetical protein